jgi:hypothetical protein
MYGREYLMKNNFYLLCLFSFLILTSCNQKEKKHILVKEGIGFDNVILYRTTKSEIYKLFGTDYKQIIHNKYSIEDYYEKLGISFYHSSYNKKRRIEFINFNRNFYGKTSKGFDIQSMTFNDLLKIYGTPFWRFSKESNEIIMCYGDLGIEFCIDKKEKIPDSIPETYFTNDIYINRLLIHYFKSVYGLDKIKEFTILLRNRTHSKSLYLGKSEIDSVFPIDLTKRSFGVLGNRLKVKLPEGLSITCDDQNYVEFEKNKQSFSFHITDYNCLASKDMKTDVAKIVQSWGSSEYSLKNIIINNDVSIYVIEPHKLKLDDNGRFWLKSAFVKNCDNTILYLNFVINTNAWYNLKNYQKLSNEIIKSIQAGSKQLNSIAEAVQIKTRQRKIRINKPAGLIYNQNNGPDFRVFVFKKLVHFNEPQSSILVYIGNHPNYIYNQSEEPVIIEKKYGLLFGQKVEWNFCYNNKKKKLPYTIEGICKFDSKDDVHIAMRICSAEDKELFIKSLPETEY